MEGKEKTIIILPTDETSDKKTSEYIDDTSDLVVAAKTGDQEALNELASIYTPRIISFLISKFHITKEEAEDVAHTVWEKAQRKIGQVKDKYFSTWLHAIARNYYLDKIRSNKINDAFINTRLKDFIEMQTKDMPTAIDEIYIKELRIILLKALEQIPTEQSDIIRRKIIDDKKFKEIAKDINLSEMQVKKRYYKGISTLSDMLNKEELLD